MAQSGHDLLDQKRQVLMMELVRYIDSAKKIQEDVAKIFQDAYDALQKANVSLGIDTVGDISESIPITTDITVRLHSIMGVEIPDIDPLNGEAIPSYSFHGSSGAMDAAYAKFRSRRASTASRCRYARRTAASTRSRRSSYRRTWRRYVSSRTCSKKATARTSRE